VKVFLAEHAGFCFGVERAVSLVEETSGIKSNVCTLGPIIHNPQVVKRFSEKGVSVCKSADDIKDGSTVIIRSHGVTKQTYQNLAQKGVETVDATCPFVKKAQKSAGEFSEKGFSVVVFGETEHPEVEGIVSFIDGDYYIISSEEEAQTLPYFEKCALVAQTTQNKDTFSRIKEILRNKCGQLETANTICSATEKRQSAAIELAKKADVMIVVGGKNSANTTRLFTICSEICPRAYHIETVSELEGKLFKPTDTIGIAAGASTPGDLIKEVIEYFGRGQEMNVNNSNSNDEMRMEDFETLLEESLNLPERGAIVKGVIAQINETEILVNIGYKTEGIISKSEFGKGEIDAKVGDEIDVMYQGTTGGGGYVKLSRKAIEKESDWLAVESALETGAALKVKVISSVDKGFLGKFNDIDCFIPENHIDFKNRMQDPKSYIGKEIECKVLKTNKKQRSFLASRRINMSESMDKNKKEFFDGIKQGDTLKGTVKTVKNYGAFMNFGAVDGFLHKNNIGWGVVKHPSQYLKEGEELEVIVIAIDKDNEKLEVGLKQINNDPWTSVDDKYPDNQIVKGTVITRKSKGFVLELEPGVDGFVPQEEISWLKNTKVKLEPKDVVEGVVVGVDNANRKVIVSLRLLNENPWDTLRDKNPEGSTVKGVIKSVTEFGLFVDFGEFLDGLIRKKDISWTDEPEDLSAYKEGQEIEAKVLKIDPERERISLGLKQLEPNPWREIGKLLPLGKFAEVEVKAVTKDGLTVALPRGLNGFIPVSELDIEKIEPENKFKVGDVIKAVVIKNDQKERSVILSIKRHQQDSERKEVKEFLKKMDDGNSSFSLGSMLKEKLDAQNNQED
jgi:small subunit ribosomal protein S1